MPTVLSYTNAYPGGPFLQHLTGETATVQSYTFPGAVQPMAMPAVLSYKNAYPGVPFPQHLTGMTATVQSYIFPGAVQPLGAAAPWGFATRDFDIPRRTSVPTPYFAQ
jgi:hypothetical protein